MSKYQPKPKINYSPGPWKDDISDFGDLSLNTSRTTWWYPNGTLASIDDTSISTEAMIAVIERAREIVGRIDGSYWT